MSVKEKKNEVIEPEVKEVEFTKEENRAQARLFEGDFIKGLIEAANHKKDTQRIEIIRDGTLYFAFDIHPLTEEDYDKCKKKHTKYVRNKQLGITVPQDTNTIKYRSALIYTATVESDRNSLWDNRQVWNALDGDEIQIMNGLDVIENVLKSGEKDRVIECIDKLSGYDNNNLEEVAKN